jgi:hypothetical protein
MRKRSRSEAPPFLEFGALIAVWSLFYGLLVIHGLTTPYAQRLAKAVAVQDSAEGAPGGAQALRASLSLSANRITQ